MAWTLTSPNQTPSAYQWLPYSFVGALTPPYLDTIAGVEARAYTFTIGRNPQYANLVNGYYGTPPGMWKMAVPKGTLRVGINISSAQSIAYETGVILHLNSPPAAGTYNAIGTMGVDLYTLTTTRAFHCGGGTRQPIWQYFAGSQGKPEDSIIYGITSGQLYALILTIVIAEELFQTLGIDSGGNPTGSTTTTGGGGTTNLLPGNLVPSTLAPAVDTSPLTSPPPAPVGDWSNDRPGPWNFTEQPNKWGYLNNPRWQPQPTNQVNYTGNEGAEPQVWTPPGTRFSSGDKRRHLPCGHWHKIVPFNPPFIMEGSEFYQQSIDVYKGRIALCGMGEDIAGLDPGQIVCAIRENDGTWYGLGGFKNISQYLEPSTLRITDDYVYYYTVAYNYADPDASHAAIFRFGHNDYPRMIDVWTGYNDGYPLRLADYHIKDVMDAQGSRVACIARLTRVNGVAVAYFQVKVSDDNALSFPKVWSFPTAGSLDDKVVLRMSEDGVVWVAYLRRPSVGNDYIELWKSNSAATSFTKVWERDVQTDAGSAYVYWLHFDIEEYAGENCTIKVMWFSDSTAPGVYDEIVYDISNYGAASSMAHHQYPYPPTDDRPYSRLTSDGDNVVNGSNDGFYLSSDGGASFSLVDPSPITLSGDYPDIQKYHNEVVFTDCGASFSPPGADDSLLGLLYSRDNGATWEVIQSPVKSMNPEGLTVSVPTMEGYTESIVDEGNDNVTVTITHVETSNWVIREFPEGIGAAERLVLPSPYQSRRWIQLEVMG